MLIGYMRVSSADERQSVDLQRDALIAAGVDERHLHQDRASGARDDRPGLKACAVDDSLDLSKSIIPAPAECYLFWDGGSFMWANVPKPPGEKLSA